MPVRDRYASVYKGLYERRSRHPKLRRAFRSIRRAIPVPLPVEFSGWGMSTRAASPWNGGPLAAAFMSAENRASSFAYTADAGISRKRMGELRWRHWIVFWAASYAASINVRDAFTLVECGVADGTTACFALEGADQALDVVGSPRASAYLYDAWAGMRPSDLAETEEVHAGRYASLSLSQTQKNLEPYGDRVVYRMGYIPDSFSKLPAPESVHMVHVDLNASGPTLAACEFFWPRLDRRGLFLFDDYGALGYETTRAVIDEFFCEKPGSLLVLPTGQALYFT